MNTRSYSISIKDVDNQCLIEIKNSIISILKNRKKIEESMKLVVESMTVSDDWSKSDFFAKRLDRKILQDFRSIEDKLDYRLFIVKDLFEKLSATSDDMRATYQETRYLSYIELALAHFQKSSFIYLTMFYLTFGNIEERSELLARKEGEFFSYISRSAVKEKEMDLNEFLLFIIEGAKDCKFQEYGCAVLIRTVKIDRGIDFP